MKITEVYKKYLPIGTVVLLKGAKKRMMITGFCASEESEPDKIWDYTGCLYPEGVLQSNETALFQHDQIERIFYFGYSDDDEKEFKNKLNDYMKQKEENIKK